MAGYITVYITHHTMRMVYKLHSRTRLIRLRRPDASTNEFIKISFRKYTWSFTRNSFPTIININMADARKCEVGAAIAPLN
jgi:hypothetical protein